MTKHHAVIEFSSEDLCVDKTFPKVRERERVSGLLQWLNVDCEYRRIQLYATTLLSAHIYIFVVSSVSMF